MDWPAHVHSFVAVIALVCCIAGQAIANTVTDWNATLEAVEKAADRHVTGRSGAILHIALFDAVNSIAGRYTPCYVRDAAPNGIDPDTAADYAAYTVLIALYPTEKVTLRRRLERSLQRLHHPRNSRAVTGGRVWGETVARLILAWRRKDGFDTRVKPFWGKHVPGQWRPVPPAETRPGILPQFGKMVPFVMRTPSQFRPGPPPALNSTQFAADLREVRLVGARHSSVRTAEQTQIAEFDNDDAEIHWNRIARTFVKPDAGLLETARLFALLNITLADTGIFCFDAKYTYNFWRPITAIHESNPPDPYWRPLLPTPGHPDYVSRHCASAGAASVILIQFFGDKTPFRDTSDSLPGVTRHYANFTALCKETREARTLAGIHFRTADVTGERGGMQVARYVLATQLILRAPHESLPPAPPRRQTGP